MLTKGNNGAGQFSQQYARGPGRFYLRHHWQGNGCAMVELLEAFTRENRAKMPGGSKIRKPSKFKWMGKNGGIFLPHWQGPRKTPACEAGA